MQCQIAARARAENGSRGKGGREGGVLESGMGCSGGGGCCHLAVCCMNAHSGVNLLEELESSA